MGKTDAHSQLLVIFGVHIPATDCTSLPELEQYFTLNGFEDIADDATKNCSQLIHYFKSSLFLSDSKLTVIKTDATKVVDVKFYNSFPLQFKA